MKPGEKHHKLTAIKRLNRKTSSNNYYWLFQCDCGNTVECLPANVRKKKNGIKSCGCILKSRRHGESWLTQMIIGYKRHAKQIGVEYSLTREEVKKLATQSCIYCGAAPKNGVDRVNSLEGYSISNCVSCCKMCNYMKRDFSFVDFMSQIKKIYARHKVVVS